MVISFAPGPLTVDGNCISIEPRSAANFTDDTSPNIVVFVSTDSVYLNLRSSIAVKSDKAAVSILLSS